MRVKDHERHSWFLFEQGDALLLDVNCSHGPAGYSVMLRLNAEEESEYSRGGHAFLSRLAQAVQDSGPGGAYQSRDVSAAYGRESLAAVNDWREAGPGG